MDCTVQAYIINAILFCRHHGGKKRGEEPEKCKCNWRKIINSFELGVGVVLFRVGNNCESFLL